MYVRVGYETTINRKKILTEFHQNLDDNNGFFNTQVYSITKSNKTPISDQEILYQSSKHITESTVYFILDTITYLLSKHHLSKVPLKDFRRQFDQLTIMTFKIGESKCQFTHEFDNDLVKLFFSIEEGQYGLLNLNRSKVTIYIEFLRYQMPRDYVDISMNLLSLLNRQTGSISELTDRLYRGQFTFGTKNNLHSSEFSNEVKFQNNSFFLHKAHKPAAAQWDHFLSCVSKLQEIKDQYLVAFSEGKSVTIDKIEYMVHLNNAGNSLTLTVYDNRDFNTYGEIISMTFKSHKDVILYLLSDKIAYMLN